MSVLKVNRTPSKYSVITDAITLYDMLMDFAERGFGIKDVNKFVRAHCSKEKTFEENVAEYSYFIRASTIRIEGYAAKLTNELRAAHNLYPINMEELNIRREHQDNAIACCECLINELQRIVRKLDVDINLYEKYVDAIYREIDKIKRWRQRDNSLKSRFQSNG